MATGTITSLGLGSNLDLQNLLDTQKKADEAVAKMSLDEVEKLQKKEKALSSVQSKLLSMKSSALSLSLSSTYLYRNITSSKNDVTTATVADGTDIGTHTVVTSRLASYSAYISDGVNDTALEDGQKLTISYGSKDNPSKLTITGTPGGMSVQDVVDAVNNDGAMSQYVTASTYQGKDGIHIQIKSSSGDSGEANRVGVTGSEGVTSFTAPDRELSFTLGSGKAVTLSVKAETTLKDLVKQINEADDNPGVKAKLINTGTGDNPYQLVLKAEKSGENNRVNIISQPDGLNISESTGKGYIMTGDETISFETAVTIDANNNTIIFEEVDKDGKSVSLTATIDTGSYQKAEELAEAVEKALENSSKEQGNNVDYQIEIDSATGLMSISEAGTLKRVTIDWENSSSTAASTLGFTQSKTITPMDASLNAMLTVDGNTYQRQDNTGIDNIIEGVNLKLYATGSSSITIGTDTEDIITEITSLVEAYNTLLTEIDENDNYKKDEESWGPLAQSATIRTLKQTLQDLITTSVDTGGPITSLLDIGIKIDDNDDTLTLDKDALKKVLSNNFDGVTDLLKGKGDVEGLGDKLNDSFGSYALSGGYLQDEIDTIKDKVDRQGKDYKEEMVRIEKKYEMMALEYTKLDSYLSKMASIENYIKTMTSTSKEK